jgi:hypothetical protein
VALYRGLTVYRITDLPVRCTWGLACSLTGGTGTMVSENEVLRTIGSEEKKEVTGGRRKLHNEELHDLCCKRGPKASKYFGRYLT